MNSNHIPITNHNFTVSSYGTLLTPFTESNDTNSIRKKNIPVINQSKAPLLQVYLLPSRAFKSLVVVGYKHQQPPTPPPPPPRSHCTLPASIHFNQSISLSWLRNVIKFHRRCKATIAAATKWQPVPVKTYIPLMLVCVCVFFFFSYTHHTEQVGKFCCESRYPNREGWNLPIKI